jgi:hypothetical protein
MSRMTWTLAISSLALAGCSGASGGCPPLVTYSASQQKAAARELRALRKDSQLAVMIVDYGKTRRACRILRTPEP